MGGFWNCVKDLFCCSCKKPLDTSSQKTTNNVTSIETRAIASQNTNNQIINEVTTVEAKTIAPLNTTSQTNNEVAASESGATASLNHLLSSLRNLNPKLDLTGLLPQNLQFKTFGGCSDIWFGHLTDGMQVAVKRARVQGNKDDEEKFIKRVKRELRIWFQMNHENILPLRGYAREPNNVCPSLVSEWMTNGSLSNFIQTTNFDKLEMMIGITRGLDYLHSNGVVHGDLKSANVVISPSFTPLLTDFGISQFLIANATRDNPTTASGTVRWMAPELVDASQVYEDREGKKKVDIWALGMVYLEILTKRLPYAHIYNDLRVVGELIQKKEPAYPEDFSMWSKRSKALWEVARSCWNFDPSERPSTGQLLDTLTKIQNGEMMTEDRNTSGYSRPPYAEGVSTNGTGNASTANSSRGLSTKSPSASHHSTSTAPTSVSLDQESQNSTQTTVPAPSTSYKNHRRGGTSQSQGMVQPEVGKGSSSHINKDTPPLPDEQKPMYYNGESGTAPSQPNNKWRPTPPTISRSDAGAVEPAGRLHNPLSGQNHEGDGSGRKKSSDEPQAKQVPAFKETFSIPAHHTTVEQNLAAPEVVSIEQPKAVESSVAEIQGHELPPRVPKQEAPHKTLVNKVPEASQSDAAAPLPDTGVVVEPKMQSNTEVEPLKPVEAPKPVQVPANELPDDAPRNGESGQQHPKNTIPDPPKNVGESSTSKTGGTVATAPKPAAARKLTYAEIVKMKRDGDKRLG